MSSNLLKDKSIYIHIGIGKTGTTALQKFLYYNKRKLAGSGFLYPSIGMNDHAHHYLGQLWGVGWMPRKWLEGKSIEDLWGKVAETFLKNDKNIIISTESLSRTFVNKPSALEEINQILGDGNIKIIVYLRRQDLHAESAYNQKIKTALTNDKPDKIHLALSKVYDYYSFLKKIENVVEKKNIIIRTYEKEQFFGGSIYTDFMNSIGIDSIEGYNLPTTDPNPRINRDVLEFLRVSNSFDDEWETKLQFNDTARRALADHFPPGDAALLSHENRMYILDKYTRSNENVAKEYLGRVNRKLFLDPSPTGIKNDSEYSGLSNTQAVRMAYLLWQYLHGRYVPQSILKYTYLKLKNALKTTLKHR